jgi:antitoxin (DNA-binding transcriptional repressor) of toxin-antitoxin stability system
MNETIMTIEEASRCLPDLVDRVHADGKEAILLKSGRPFVRIVPMPNGAHDADELIAFLRRWRKDHPEPDEQFAAAIEESRLGAQEPRNPWD